MLNAFTVDVEDWCQGIPEIPFEKWEEMESRIEVGLYPILDLLADYSFKGTFFVLGYIAEHFPDVVKEISSRGHEVGVHGYNHTALYTISPEEFGKNLEKSVALLEKISKKKIISFRAPYFSVVKKTSWAIEILARNGIKYDSSIFPVKTHLYGIPDAPPFPYRPLIGSIIENDPHGDILEIPPTTTYSKILKRRIPIAGGFYFRALPYNYIKRKYKEINEKDYPIIFYIHPWELDKDQPKLKNLPFKSKFIHYHNIYSGGVRKKLYKLLSEFEFTSIKNLFKSY